MRGGAARASEAEAEAEGKAEEVERNAGRAAMVGFVACSVGDALTRGEGPLAQLVDEERWVVARIDPLTFVKDVLEVGEVYVETLTLLWVWVLVVFLIGLGSGLVRPTVVDESAKDAPAPDLGSAFAAAVQDSLSENRDAELLNGRLAMVGITLAAFGEELTGQGPLEQLSLETGIPAIGIEGWLLAFGGTLLFTATGAAARTFRQTLERQQAR